jgi:hypothetical protein
MNQLCSLLVERLSLDASDYSGRLLLHLLPARHFCLPNQKSILKSPQRPRKAPISLARERFPSVQSWLLLVGFIYGYVIRPAQWRFNPQSAPIKLGQAGTRSPKRSPLVPLRAAYCCAAHGSSTRFDAAALSTVVSTFALPAASNLNRWAAIKWESQ